MVLENKLKQILTKYEALGERLLDPNALSSQEYQKISKEHADLSEVANLAFEYHNVKKKPERIAGLAW